jgi:hypothetical protein
MNDKPHYALEKFGESIHNLATGGGEVEARLFDAYMPIAPLSLHDIPDELQLEYNELLRLLQAKDPEWDERELFVTIRDMGERKVIQIAEMIFNIYLKLSEMCRKGL